MELYPLLQEIESPKDLRKLELSQLPELCAEVREYIIETLSLVGGHFASNLGVVELTVALHYVLDTPHDKLIWDVGHQIYPHKLLTGRRERLKSVRRFGGLSGFPKREESEYDLYNTGHAGTSISQMIGEAAARDSLGLEHQCVSVIGDASSAAGMAFEALNHGGELQTDCLVVLNDNDMSISHNVGALNQYLNRLISSPFYNRWRKYWFSFLLWVPVIGPVLQLYAKKLEKNFKDLLTPGSLFLDFGFRYFGPVDGHDVKELVRILRRTLKLKGPKIMHAFTQKGRGYQPAENDPIRYHGVPTFNREDGSFAPSQTDNNISYSEIVGETLLEIAEHENKLAVITPAMIEGSGLRPLYEKYPAKVYDVGIAEQHSMSFAGGLASGGMIPFLCIYSTFLVRAMDQLIQDVALMNLPVRIIVDRAGCIGQDGETHQGLFDMGLLLSAPNVRLFAPANGADLKAILLHLATDNQGPIAIRFPKAICDKDELKTENLPDMSTIAPEIFGGKPTSPVILCIGTMLQTGLETRKRLLKDSGVDATVVCMRWIRPFDKAALEKALSATSGFVIVEDSYIESSAASHILSRLDSEIRAKHKHTFAFPLESIEHGRREEIMHKYGLSPAAIYTSLKKMPAFSGKEKRDLRESSG